jgi:hypothetical protein
VILEYSKQSVCLRAVLLVTREGVAWLTASCSGLPGIREDSISIIQEAKWQLQFYSFTGVYNKDLGN